MKILLKLIYKNILKYKRKTIIVFISILLSVIIVVFSQGFIEGFNNMLLELIFNNLGHVTIRHSEYEKGEIFLSLDYLVHHYSSLCRCLSNRLRNRSLIALPR